MGSSDNLRVVKGAVYGSRVHNLIDRVAYFIWDRGFSRGAGCDWVVAQAMIANHYEEGFDIEADIERGLKPFDKVNPKEYYDLLANDIISMSSL